jgi:deoxyribonuclease (pyrimidine dimer)
MTRINVVPPEELCNQHLFAEYRELTRIPNGIASGKMQTSYRDAPLKYTLGSGHVKYFADKLGFLKKRYYLLQEELTKRGYRVQDIWPQDLPKYASFLDYEPTAEALALNRARIQERMPANPRWSAVNKQQDA